MGSGFSKMKKQAKMMQEQIGMLRDQMQKSEFEGSAGNGLVKVVLNGEKELKKVSIQPECASDMEALQDLLIAAFQDAKVKIDAQQTSHNMPFFPSI